MTRPYHYETPANRFDRYDRESQIMSAESKPDCSNQYSLLPIEKIIAAKIDLRRDGNKATLQIIRGIISNMSDSVFIHYHRNFTNKTLAQFINTKLGFDAIRVDSKSRVRLTIEFLKKLR